jgi:hypothetical protein
MRTFPESITSAGASCAMMIVLDGLADNEASFGMGFGFLHYNQLICRDFHPWRGIG